MSVTTTSTQHTGSLLSRIVKAFIAARRPVQPAWLRDARDEDLLKVGLTRGALLASIPARRGIL